MKKHLSEIELGAYIEGKLSPEKRAEIERYLNADSKSHKEFVAIKRVIEGTVPDLRTERSEVVESGLSPACPPEHLIQKVLCMYPESQGLFDIVIGLVRDAVNVVYTASDISVAPQSPAFALRNNGTSGPSMAMLTKPFKDFDVALDVEKVRGDFCNIKVVVTGVGGNMLDKARVELFSGDRELASYPLEEGEAIFEDIMPGRYEIRIFKNGEMAGELAMKIE